MADVRDMQVSAGKRIAAFLWVGLCLLFFASSARGEPSARDILSHDGGQRLMLDNPRQLIAVVEPFLQSGKDHPDSLLELRAFRLYAEGLVELGDTERLKPWIPKLQGISRRTDKPEMLAEALLVQSLLVYEGQSFPTEEEKEQAFQTLRAAAHRASLYAVEAKILTRYSIFLTDKGAFLRATELQSEILNLVHKASGLSEMDQAIIKTALAQLYQRLGQGEKSLALMLEVLDYSEGMNLRYLAATTQFNLGSYYEKLADAASRLKAKAAYEAARKRAEDIGDPMTVGASLLGLGRIYMEMKDSARAILYFLDAVSVFKELEQIVWLGEVYLKLGQALAKAGRYQEAEQALENAEIYFPPDYLEDHNRILEQRAYTQYALGNKDAAFAALKEHTSVHKKLNQDKFNQNLTQLVVRMGLKVAEDRNAMLIKENEGQQQRIVEAERLRSYLLIVLGLSVLVMGFLGFSLWSAREVKKSRRKLQRILDNIDEGILTVDRSLSIEPHYSRHVHKIFDGSDDDLAGTEVLKALGQYSSLHPEALNLLRESLLASLGSDVLSWELNNAHVPIEISLKKQGRDHRIAINWVPLMNRGKQIEGFLLGLRDVTERRRLEAQIHEEKLKSDRLTHILRELAQTDRKRAAELLSQVAELLGIQEPRPAPDSLKRTVHTHKGVARSLGLWELSRFLHTLEDILVAGLKVPESAQGWEILRPTWEALYRDYNKILQDLGMDQSSQDSRSSKNLLGLVSFKSHLLAEHLRQYGYPSFTLSVSDGVNHWPPSLIEVLEKVLVHALINAADHGYVLPPKPDRSRTEPHFAIAARRLPTHVEVRIMDRGAGLNMPRIREMAAQNQIPMDDDQAMMEVLFLDGVTTAEYVTHSSGRGVGLASIRSLVASAQGRVLVENNQDGPGTSLILEFPLTHFTREKAAA